jgi:hypothetical protein
MSLLLIKADLELAMQSHPVFKQMMLDHTDNSRRTEAEAKAKASEAESNPQWG